jgi:hypothetical protein
MSNRPLLSRSSDAFVLGQRGLTDLLTTVNSLGRSRLSTCCDLRRRLLGRNTEKRVILITLHNRAAQSAMRKWTKIRLEHIIPIIQVVCPLSMLPMIYSSGFQHNPCEAALTSTTLQNVHEVLAFSGGVQKS